MIARRLSVTGRVQGVFFRAWTAEQARSLGLAGWVRNRRDGSVEILAQGDDAAVEALAERCRNGPPAASVDEVGMEAAEPEPLDGFDTRPTL